MIALFTFGWFSSPASAAGEVRIVAVVNNEVITSYELDQAMKVFHGQLSAVEDPLKRRNKEAKGRQDVLEDLIRDRLLEQDFRELGVTISPVEVEEEWNRILKRLGVDEQRFRAELARQNMSESQYRQNLADHLKLLKFISRRIRSKVNVDEKDIRNEYDRNLVAYSAPDRLHLLEADVPRSLDGKDIQHFREQWARGFESMEDFSKRYPKTTITDLGSVSPSDLSPDIRQAVVSVDVGQVSSAVLAGGKRRIYKVTERAAGEPLPYEQVREEVRVRLTEKEIQKQLDLYMANLRRTAHVEVKL